MIPTFKLSGKTLASARCGVYHCKQEEQEFKSSLDCIARACPSKNRETKSRPVHVKCVCVCLSVCVCVLHQPTNPALNDLPLRVFYLERKLLTQKSQSVLSPSCRATSVPGWTTHELMLLAREVRACAGIHQMSPRPYSEHPHRFSLSSVVGSSSCGSAVQSPWCPSKRHEKN